MLADAAWQQAQHRVKELEAAAANTEFLLRKEAQHRASETAAAAAATRGAAAARTSGVIVIGVPAYDDHHPVVQPAAAAAAAAGLQTVAADGGQADEDRLELLRQLELHAAAVAAAQQQLARGALFSRRCTSTIGHYRVGCISHTVVPLVVNYVD